MEARKGSVRIAVVGVVAALLLLGSNTNLGAVPAAPANLTASVSGNTVNLSWSAPGGPVLGYRVEAGSAPGLSNLHSGVYPTTQLTAPGVPAGVYYVRVRGIAADGEGPPSNEVLVTVGGSGPCTAPPNPPNGLAATVNGSNVSFTWASGGGCPASNYALHAGSAPGLSNLAVANVGNALSLSAAAPNGTYYVQVVAQNAYGVSGPSNQQVVAVGVPGGGAGGSTALTPLSGTVNSWGWRILPVTMPASGEYRATLSWPDPSIDLDLYLTSATCTSYPPSNACLIAVSDASHGNMEQISAHLQAGQTYYVWVDSFTGRASNYLVQHTVTALTAGAATAGAATAGESRLEASELFKKPKQQQ